MPRKGSSRAAREEVLAALRGRAAKTQKRAILDQFVFESGYNRNYATWLPRAASGTEPGPRAQSSNRIYDDAFKESLIVLWEAAD